MRPTLVSLGSLALLTGLCALSMGCRGKMLARAELHAAGTAETRFQATGAPIVLWADTAGKWTGAQTKQSRFPVHYEIDIVSQGTSIGHLTCDTLESSEQVCGTRVDVGSSHSGDCELELPCTVPTIPAGDTVLKVTGKPGVNATEVLNMSVNVRAK